MAYEKPLYTLYKGLKANNYDVPDNYDSFERTLTSMQRRAVTRCITR